MMDVFYHLEQCKTNARRTLPGCPAAPGPY